jgi:hypothetical protein
MKCREKIHPIKITLPLYQYHGTPRIGFRRAKASLLAALNAAISGKAIIRHEARAATKDKNLLASGQVSLAELVAIISKSRGSDYSESPHHQAPEIVVHIISRRHVGLSWYIKWYILEPNLWFISVHY